MSAARVRTGILGVGQRAEPLLAAIEALDVWEVRAVAGAERQRCEAVAERLGCPAFDDIRQFVIQNDFTCLLVAAPLHRCLEVVRLALKQGVHVLKLPPMARNFEEASMLAGLAAAQSVRYDVAVPLRFADSLAAFAETLTREPLTRPFRLRLAYEVGLLPAGSPEGLPLHPDHALAWVTDQALAGGGVLLQDAYAWIDQVVRAFGLPQQVYALCSSQASDQQQLRHLTEDCALLMLRFAEPLAGEVRALRYWDGRESLIRLEVEGRDRILRVDPEQLGTYDSRGQELEHTQFAYDPVSVWTDLLACYAAGLLDPEDPATRYPCDATSQLGVMAVIEAAYLSGRTGSPESPARILDLAGR